MDIRKTAIICAAVLLTACGELAASQPAQVQTLTEKAETVLSAEETSAPAEADTKAESTVSSSVTEAPETTAAAEEEKPLIMPQYTESKVEEGSVSHDDNEEAVLLRFDYTSITIENEDDYPELAKAVADHTDERYRLYTEEKNSEADHAREHYSDSPDFFIGEHPGSYYLSYSSSVSHCNEKVFSILDSEYGYYGGVHGGTKNTGVTFDSQTGEQLSVSDICTDIPALLDILAAKLEADYSDAVDPVYTNSADYREVLTNAYGEDLQGYTETLYNGTEFEHGEMNFVFIPEGVVFFTNQYDITDYARGTQELTVLFTEADGIFNEKYVTVGRDYVMKADPYEVYADINGDGVGDIISVDAVHNDDWQVTGYTIKALGMEYTFEVDPDKFDDYLLYSELERKDGKYIYRLFNQDSEMVYETEL